MIGMSVPERQKRRRINTPVTPTPPAKRPKRNAKASDELQARNDLLYGMSSPAQIVASRYGMYSLATVARLVGRSPVTVRRWMRYAECPKPSHSVPYNAYEMQLFTDEDVQLLKEWAAAMKPGRRPFQTPPTRRRRANETFYRERDVQSRFMGTTKTLLPAKETPVEYWAKMRKMQLVETKFDMGNNTVTIKRYLRPDNPNDVMVDPDRRLVSPNTGSKRRRRVERRVLPSTLDTDGFADEATSSQN